MAQEKTQNKKIRSASNNRKKKTPTRSPARDLAEQQKTQKALVSSEEQFRVAFENAPIGVCLTDADGHYLKVNKAYCEMLGYSEKELLSIDFPSLSHPEELQQNIDLKNIALAGEINSFEMEKRYKTKNDTIIWVSLKSSLVRDDQNNPLYFVAHIQDITERKKTEEKIIKSEKRFRALVETVPAVVILISDDFRIIEFNPAAEKLYGIKGKDVIGKNYLELFVPKEARNQVIQNVEKTLAGKPSVGTENPMETKDGRIHYMKWYGARVLDDEGKPTAAYAFGIDITEQKKATDNLKVSEERYRSLMEEASDAIFITSGTDLLDTNTAATKILGYSKKELYSMDLMTLYHSDDAKNIQTDFATVVSGTGSAIVQCRVKHKNGSYLWMEINTKTLKDGRVQSIARNITERKKAEEALKESETRYRTLAEVAHDMIFIIDKEDRVEYVNSFGAKILGMEPEEVIGNKRSSIFPPDIAKKQGLSLNIVFETGKPMYAEGKMLANNKWINIDTSLAPIKNEGGEVTAVLGISRDVTEVKQADDLSDALNAINAKMNSILDFDKIMQSVAEESRKAIGCDSAIINLREDDHWVIGYVNGLIAQISPDTVGMRFSDLELKAAAKAIKTREIIVVQDAANDSELNSKIVDKYKIRSMMIAPLFVKDEIIGNLYYIYHTDNVEFEPAQIDFAHKLSTSLSFAIQNAHLYQEALRKTAEKTPASKN